MRKKSFLCTAVAAAALMLSTAACSSSGGSDGNSSGASTPASVGASAPAGGGVTEAKATVQAAQSFPTAISVTDPLPSKPPTGKTLVFLQCEQSSCPLEGMGIKAAAKAIGWNVKVLSFKAADPATLVTALKTALQYKPVATYFSGVPQDVWKVVQEDYKKAGAVIVPSALAKEPTGVGLIPGRGFAQDETDLGKLLASAVVADADGKGVESLLVSVPSYDVYGPVTATYKSELKRLCSSCKTDSLDVTLPQLFGGQLIPAIVSEIKRHPNIKYVASVNSSFIGQLPSALQSAGLKGKVKIVGGKGNSLDQQNVLKGDQLATVNSSFYLAGWQDVDIAIRRTMGLDIPEGDHRQPPLLLTKDNIGTPADSYDRPTDYQAQFKKLWLVG